MRSSQREAIIVLLHLLDRDLPSANRMALFAIRSKLALVNVRVAILTTLADIREHRFNVALHAGHRRVHAAERITGLIVVEFRDRPDRAPSAGSVAVLAGSGEVAVRTMRSSGGLRRSASQVSGKCPQHRG